MTARDIGFAVLKLMGLYYLVSAVFSFITMVGWLWTPPSESLPDPKSMAASALASVVVFAALSSICLYLTNTISSWLFGDDPEPMLALGEPDRLLTVGIILIGVALLGSNLAGAARFTVEFIRNLEGSRRPFLGEFLLSAWYDSGTAFGSALVGAFLMVRGDLIAERLSPWRHVGNEIHSDEAAN